MAQINLRENESLESALRKLRRMGEKANIWAAIRKKEFYEKPTSQRKREKMAAVKRALKKLSSQRIPHARRTQPHYYAELQTIIRQQEEADNQ